MAVEVQPFDHAFPHPRQPPFRRRLDAPNGHHIDEKPSEGGACWKSRITPLSIPEPGAWNRGTVKATAAGTVGFKAPRVNDKRVDAESGERKRFSSAILTVARRGG
jgi:hypothetical protein